MMIATAAYAQPPELNEFNPAEHFNTSNPNAAFVKIKNSLSVALKENDQTKAALAYQDLGELFYYQAAYSQAVRYFYKAHEIFSRK